MRRLFARFSEEHGQGLMEYGLITVLASIVAIGALTSLGSNILSKLYEPASAMF